MYHVTSRVSLTGGARYTRERKDLDTGGGLYRLDTDIIAKLETMAEADLARNKKAYEDLAKKGIKPKRPPADKLLETARTLTADSKKFLEEKKLVVNMSRQVKYVADGTQLEHVGGLDSLKEWLLERRRLFLERDSLSSEIVPKGLLVMGVSGCGKSLSVKAIAEYFGLPLYRIDMIEVYSGRHGTPDGAFVEACRIVESVAPAVVWFDEIEMGLTAQTERPGGKFNSLFLMNTTPGARRSAKPSSTSPQFPNPASGALSPVTRASSRRSVIPAPAKYARAISLTASSLFTFCFNCSEKRASGMDQM